MLDGLQLAEDGPNHLCGNCYLDLVDAREEDELADTAGT